MATWTEYKVERVVRNGGGDPSAQAAVNHNNFDSRLEGRLNELALDDWEIVDIGIGRYDAIIIACAEFTDGEED